MRAVVSAIDEIRLLFEACGYTVSEQVGAVPGSVDRFATPRHGLMPPRTWWTVVPRFPEDLAEANERLDLARDEVGADRALAIVTDEPTPALYTPDLVGGVANHVSLRVLAFHLAGVFDTLNEIVREPVATPYFQHRLSGGLSADAVDACERIDAWIEGGTEHQLELRGTPFAALGEIAREATRRRAKRFLERPEHVVPIVMGTSGERPSTAVELLLERGWAVYLSIPSSGADITIRRFSTRDHTGDISESVEELFPPSTDDILTWFRSALPVAPTEPLRSWLSRDESNRRVLMWPALRASMLSAALDEQRSPVDDSWVPRLLARAFQRTFDDALGDEASESSPSLEEAAFREFALGKIEDWAASHFSVRLLRNSGFFAKRQESWSRLGFASTTVRDWFVARWIIRQVRSGNREILTRYVLPRVDVGLFLAVLAPDVAALSGAGKAEELRREVESEVARRVELTLGHQLNRSIGTIGTHVSTVRRALRESDIDDRTRTAFSRIEQELDHLRKLTDRSRLLNESREWEITSQPLLEVVASVTEPLRERHADIAVETIVPADLVVRAALDGLREILHCLVENAFHSVAAVGEDRSRRIEISALRAGETVRIQVKDNGIGVRPEDRERIFQPFVTTKTGGPGQARGTGLGLSIARTFAERMGARVTLESSNGETVFVLVLVAGN